MTSMHEKTMHTLRCFKLLFLLWLLGGWLLTTVGHDTTYRFTLKDGADEQP